MKKQEKGINRWRAREARAPQAFKKQGAASAHPQRFKTGLSGSPEADTPDSTETSNNQQSTI
jgi:hypothetical protein